MTANTEHHLKVRNLHKKDYKTLSQLLQKAYPDGSSQWPDTTLERLIDEFPEGQLGIEDNGVLVAAALAVGVDYHRYSNPTRYEDLQVDRRKVRHDSKGDALYGLDLFVHPDYQDHRLGQRLYETRKDLCRQQNLKAILSVGRIPGYANHAAEVSAAQYVQDVERKRYYDPVLSFQLANDFDIKRLLKRTTQSNEPDYATLLEWDNIFYEPEPASVLTQRKTNVRVGAVQWQMRRTDSVDSLLSQVEFFVQSMSAYKADFALFPEFFNAPLMGLLPETNALEAMRELAALTPQMLERISLLAVSYNINIIAGSMPLMENGELYNVAYLCKRDGTVDSQYKIHPTPGERFEWAMKGGDRLTVFDTDAGRIGILICYDVEFPELSRLLCLQGMEMLFVPFWTDTKNGFLRVQRCAQARAIENECYVVIAGSCGNLPEVNNLDIQYAQSAVYSPSDFAFPHDAIVSETTPNTEMELLVDLDLEKLKRLRNEGAVTNFKDRREDLYELRWIGKS